VNNPVLSNVKDEAISIIRRNQETAMKVMAKYMKNDNRKTLEAVYEEHAPVFQRLLMTKEEVQAVLEVAKNPKAAQIKPEDFSIIRSCKSWKPPASLILCMPAND
jgi:phosphohistidine phosphatase SixA